MVPIVINAIGHSRCRSSAIFSIDGLTPVREYAAKYRVVIDQGVEIYRLSLTSQVPEPATLALLLLVLGMLSMRCRQALRPLSAR